MHSGNGSSADFAPPIPSHSRPQEGGNRRGTAYVITVGIVVLLALLLVGYFRTSHSRRFSTRFMSHEKRVEALAEAAVELVARYLKDNVNPEDDPQLFAYFRFIAPLSSPNPQASPLGRGNGGLEPAFFPPPLVFEGIDKKPLMALKDLVDDLGGNSNVPSLKVTCEILQAQGFAAFNEKYEIPGITIPPTPAWGEPSRFLDGIDRVPESGGSLKSLSSDARFRFELPNLAAHDEHKVVLVGLAAIFAQARVFLDKLSETAIKIFTKIVALGFLDISGMMKENPRLLDIDEEIRKTVAFPKGKRVSMPSIRSMIMGEIEDFLSRVEWRAGVLHQSIRAGWDKLPPFPPPIDVERLRQERSTAFGAKPLVIEKVGTVRLTAHVEFVQGGTGGGGIHIRKVLQADREFKVSDLQPPAPEYAFFVANSPLLFERPEDKNAIPDPADISRIGKPIEWRFPPEREKAGILATFTIHPLPEGSPLPGGDYRALTGFDGCGGTPAPDSNCLVPGLVRVNSDGMMKINTFIGSKDEPFQTEYNAMTMDKFKPNSVDPPIFQWIPTFNWLDMTAYPDRPHQVDFPVLHNTDRSIRPFIPVGTKNLLKILQQCDGLAAPSLLFGYGHIEYPLGLRAEAFMQMRYGNVHVGVLPKGAGPPPKDLTESYIEYRVPENDFGLVGKPAFEKSDTGQWSPYEFRNMPENVYSILQYAKKATHYYENEEDFWRDVGRPIEEGGRSDKGVFDCTGVTYIKGSLRITADKAGKPWKVKGKGILVAKGNIFVQTDIMRQDKDPGTPGSRPGDVVFTLMARAGSIMVRKPCTRIEAACFSNATLTNPAGNPLVIDGNLVINQFNRSFINSVEVYFNAAACRITPLSVMRDVGKFEPRRYHASLGKRWLNLQYVKQ